MEILPQAASTNLPGAVISGGNISPEQVQPCDFATIGGVDEARLSPLVKGSEALANSLPSALQSKLRLTCEIALQGSEQVACRTFLEKAGSSYIVLLELGAHSDIALLQVDSALLFPIIDRLLGGGGEASELSREVTEIEDQIARDFVRVVCQELQSAWKSFKVSVEAGARQSWDHLQKVFSASDNALVFNFTVTMQSVTGGLQLMLPVASMGAFLGSNTVSIHGASRKGTMNARFVENSLDWSFALELTLVGGKVSANDLLNLSVGKILPLGVSVRTPAVLKIGGHDAYKAVPVRSGKHRGAQLLERVQKSQPETGNTL
jgi:flagellar motor switch protein FliM